MNRFVHNMKRMLECQLYDYYFLLHQNNFAYVIHLKEKLEKIVDGKKDLSYCQRIWSTSFRLFDWCKEKKMDECLMCRFCINETDKEKLN